MEKKEMLVPYTEKKAVDTREQDVKTLKQKTAYELASHS